MKTVSEVVAALKQRYAGRTKEVKGSGGNDYTYIGWDDAVRELDEVFGPDGWSAEPTSFEGHPAEGIYLASVKLTGRALDDDGSGVVVEFSRPGFGRGVARASRSEAERTGSPVSSDLGTHDTAAATAGSDALSRATKLLGDRFGLYLYDKAQNGTSTGDRTSRPQSPNFSNVSPFGNKGNGGNFTMKDPGAPATAAQVGKLKALGVDEQAIRELTKGQASQMIDSLSGNKAVGY